MSNVCLTVTFLTLEANISHNKRASVEQNVPLNAACLLGPNDSGIT